MEEEIALLQFVALALPAVAILMQAVVRFHEQYIDSGSESALHIEFRLLEFTFLGLVVAGATFAISIYQGITSQITRIGIGLLSLSLLMIFPATWFTFRRAKYPTKSFETPEGLVKYAGKVVIKIGVIGFPIIIVVILLQFTDLSIQSIDQINIFALIAGLIIGAIAAGITAGGFQYYLLRVERRMAKNWEIFASKKLANLRTRLKEEEYKTEDGYKYRKLRTIANEIEEAVEDLDDNPPSRVPDAVLRDLSELRFKASNLSNLVTDIIEIEEEIVTHERNLNEATTDKEMSRKYMREGKDHDIDNWSEMSEELKSRIEMSESYIKDVKNRIDALIGEKRELKAEIEYEVNDIRSSLNDLISDLKDS